MSITSAMFSGVSGLLANAEGINIIGNNLANVNTTGFKASRMLFSDMLSVNIGTDSQIGRGAQIQQVDNLFSQGSFENTEEVTDLAIQGNSFFAMKTPSQAAPLTSQSSATLTRAGAFRLDSDKFLINPDGYQLLDTSGNPIQFTDNALAISTTLTNLLPKITDSWTAIALAADSSNYVAPATAGLTAASDAVTAAQTVLAAAQSAAATATASTDGASIVAAATSLASARAAVTAAQAALTAATLANRYAASTQTASTGLVTAGGNLTSNPNDANAIAAESANALAYSALTSTKSTLSDLESALAAAGAALSTAGTDLTAVGTALTAIAGVTYDAAGATAGTAGTAAGTAGTAATTGGTTLGTAIAAADTEYTDAINASIASTAAFTTFYDASAAAFAKVSRVDSDGLITYLGKYGDTYFYDSTNAIGVRTASATASEIAGFQRVAVINPSNPGGMAKMGGTLFQINSQSGVSTDAFSLSSNKINGASEKMISNTLEQSNVDMAGQFVKMILTQRAYSANSKTITTADEMTQEVLNLKR